MTDTIEAPQTTDGEPVTEEVQSASDERDWDQEEQDDSDLELAAAEYRAEQQKVKPLRRIEAQVARHTENALKARWEFGRRATQDGWMVSRLVELLNLSEAEIRNRMQLAREYPDKAQLANALVQYGSWFGICKKGLGNRGKNGTADEGQPPEKPTRSVDAYCKAADRFCKDVGRVLEQLEAGANFARWGPMIDSRHQKIRQALTALDERLERAAATVEAAA